MKMSNGTVTIETKAFMKNIWERYGFVEVTEETKEETKVNKGGRPKKS